MDAQLGEAGQVHVQDGQTRAQLNTRVVKRWDAMRRGRLPVDKRDW